MKIEIEGNRITLSFSLDEKALDLVARFLMAMQEKLPVIMAEVASSYKKEPPQKKEGPPSGGVLISGKDEIPQEDLDDIKIE